MSRTLGPSTAGTLLGLMLVLIELSIKRSRSDVEDFRRFLTIARSELEGFLNGPLLDGIHGLPHQFTRGFRWLEATVAMQSAGC